MKREGGGPGAGEAGEPPSAGTSPCSVAAAPGGGRRGPACSEPTLAPRPPQRPRLCLLLLGRGLTRGLSVPLGTLPPTSFPGAPGQDAGAPRGAGNGARARVGPRVTGYWGEELDLVSCLFYGLYFLFVVKLELMGPWACPAACVDLLGAPRGSHVTAWTREPTTALSQNQIRIAAHVMVPSPVRFSSGLSPWVPRRTPALSSAGTEALSVSGLFPEAPWEVWVTDVGQALLLSSVGADRTPCPSP